MSDLEMQVAALIRCVPENVFQRALAEVAASAPEATADRDMEQLVGEMLLEMGVPQSLSGYDYLVTAITMAVEQPELRRQVCKGLLPAAAAKHNTTWMRFERAMRHAIEVGWSRIDYETQVRYFGNSISSDKAKPTLTEFIARLANEVRRRTGR